MTNSADPDQLASSEANWSGSTLFAKNELVMFSKRRVNLQRLELLVYRTNFHGPKDVWAIEVWPDLCVCVCVCVCVCGRGGGEDLIHSLVQMNKGTFFNVAYICILPVVSK